MGTYSERYFAGQGTITPQGYKNYIDSLGADIITDSISGNIFYIHVDDAYNLFFDFNRSRMGVQLRGNSYDLAVMNTWNPQSIVICFSDNVFYIQHTAIYDTGRRLLSVYEKFDEKRFVSFIGSGAENRDSHPWFSIQDLSFICLEDNLRYSHKSRLKYTQKSGYVDYCIDNLYKGEILSDLIDPYFVSCSNITADTKLTFDDQTYYAVGANILFPIDE